MNGLLEFIYNHKHWLLFLLLEGISLVLLFTYNEFQGSIYLSSANSVSGGMLEAKQKVTSYFDLRAENEKLSEQNAKLEEQIFMLRQQIDDADLATAMNALEDRWPFDVVPANVVENSISKPDNYLTINKGTVDGLHPDMGVISSEGVVGVTYKCSKHYTLVLPVLNTRSNISCKVLPGDSFGYLEWSGGDARFAMLRDVPRYATVHVGDQVVTSGHSSFFPEGLLVGTIESFEPSADNLSNNINVRLGTKFSNLRHVFIIQNAGSEERKELNALSSQK